MKKGKLYEFIEMVGFGTTLMKIGFHKALPYFGVLFILSMASIFLSFKTEEAMLRAEKSGIQVENLKIQYAQKTCDFVGLDRISTVEEKLKGMGSRIMPPEKPADIIRKK